jgi:hypothetical protein
MFARNTVSDDRASGESCGSNSPKTFSCVVQVVVVASRPEEGLAAGDARDVARVDAPRLEDVHLRGAEVVADDADHAHVGEEARGEGEVGRGAAEHPLARAEGRLDRVERHGSHHRQSHGRNPTALPRVT